MNFAYQGRHSPSQLAAMTIRTHPSIAEQNDENPWFADSGASNHVTAALDNLKLEEPFKGDEEVDIGNDTVLPISNIGSSVL